MSIRNRLTKVPFMVGVDDFEISIYSLSEKFIGYVERLDLAKELTDLIEYYDGTVEACETRINTTFYIKGRFKDQTAFEMFSKNLKLEYDIG